MAELPEFITDNKPVPQENRISWTKSIAPAYAGIMLWYAFWQGLICLGNFSDTSVAILSQGIGPALGALVAAAAVCYILFYYVPGMLGMKTGRPLAVVGTSVFGAKGGFLLPGFLMGLLQFGWLAVNATFASILLWQCIKGDYTTDNAVIVKDSLFWGLSIVFILAAVFVAQKGMKYVGLLGQFAVIVPLVILVMLLIPTFKGVGNFKPDMIGAKAAAEQPIPAVEAEVAPAAGQDAAPAAAEAVATEAAAKPAEAAEAVAPATEVAATEATAKPAETAAEAAKPVAPMTVLAIFLGVIAYVSGFFATAGAAGVDIASPSRNKSDVIWGGFFGVFLATVLAGGVAILTVAGAYGAGIAGVSGNNPVGMLNAIWGKNIALVINILLVVTAFPAACVASLIGVTGLKTTLSKVPPLLSIGLCTIAAIAICLTGWGLDAGTIFGFIGASFGPVCGAMMAEYILSKGEWVGPRAGFSPAGWLAWLFGFIVGNWNVLPMAKICPCLDFAMPCPPVSAFLVGFVLYFLFCGLRSRVIELD